MDVNKVSAAVLSQLKPRIFDAVVSTLGNQDEFHIALEKAFNDELTAWVGSLTFSVDLIDWDDGHYPPTFSFLCRSSDGMHAVPFDHRFIYDTSAPSEVLAKQIRAAELVIEKMRSIITKLQANDK